MEHHPLHTLILAQQNPLQTFVLQSYLFFFLSFSQFPHLYRVIILIIINLSCFITNLVVISFGCFKIFLFIFVFQQFGSTKVWFSLYFYSKEFSEIFGTLSWYFYQIWGIIGFFYFPPNFLFPHYIISVFSWIPITCTLGCLILSYNLLRLCSFFFILFLFVLQFVYFLLISELTDLFAIFNLVLVLSGDFFISDIQF